MVERQQLIPEQPLHESSDALADLRLVTPQVRVEPVRDLEDGAPPVTVLPYERPLVVEPDPEIGPGEERPDPAQPAGPELRHQDDRAAVPGFRAEAPGRPQVEQVAFS